MFMLKKKHTFYTLWLRIEVNGRKGTCELGCGLRSVVEESSFGLDNRHLSLLIDKLLLLERRTALAHRDFPQATEWVEALSKHLTLGKTPGDKTHYISPGDKH